MLLWLVLIEFTKLTAVRCVQRDVGHISTRHEIVMFTLRGDAMASTAIRPTFMGAPQNLPQTRRAVALNPSLVELDAGVITTL